MSTNADQMHSQKESRKAAMRKVLVIIPRFLRGGGTLRLFRRRSKQSNIGFEALAAFGSLSYE